MNPMQSPNTGVGGKDHGHRKNKWSVTGDHPIFARPDRFNMSYQEAKDLAEELVSLGYENVCVDRNEDDAPSRPI